MSIRNSLLALLAHQPAHGYGLKSEFETSTAGQWPLNVGQVYTTLRRLERDGLVQPIATDGDDESNARQTWRITEEGRTQLSTWFQEPTDQRSPVRDELAIKVLLAIATDQDDIEDMLRTQRVATMERLQAYTRHKRKADPETELPWLLLLDALILQTEAEARWIEMCEARLQARGGSR